MQSSEAPAMGTWGTGSLQNDGASDWVYELEASSGFAFLEETLDTGLTPDYLGASEAENAIAAAETVACLSGRPGANLTESLENWVRAQSQAPTASLRAKAVAVVQRVQSASSELLELWEDTDDLEAWRTDLAALGKRLE